MSTWAFTTTTNGAAYSKDSGGRQIVYKTPITQNVGTNHVLLQFGDDLLKVLTSDTITINGSPFSGTADQLADALDALFPDAGSSASTTKVYRALLSQSGTDAPVATVLENSLGDVVWSRFASGLYKGTLAGAFPQAKTHILSQGIILSQADGITMGARRGSDDFIWVNTGLQNDGPSDDNLNYNSIQILIYP